MIDYNLQEFMREALDRTPTDFRRYMYERIPWEDRMIGLVGPRGVGKSTLVKQRILSNDDYSQWLYVSADHVWFGNNSLIGLADTWVKQGGRYLVIDEIHRYAGWSQELKQIYDSFPRLNVIFTGSSVLDIHKGSADLSRRALIFNMQGLSFREYLALFCNVRLPQYTLGEIIGGKVRIPDDFHPLPLFNDYLRKGYFPFCNLAAYEMRLQQVITQTLEVDIPQYAGMNVATSRKFKKLLSLISTMVPFKPNISNLSVELNVSRNDLPDYLIYLEMAGMIGQLRDETGGIRGLGKVEKIYLDNPNLIYSLGQENANIGNVRETFFYNQMRVNHEVVASKITDFKIGDNIFEIGGHKKGKRQLESNPNGFVVRDDIEHGHDEFVPLWQFGLTY